LNEVFEFKVYSQDGSITIPTNLLV